VAAAVECVSAFARSFVRWAAGTFKEKRIGYKALHLLPRRSITMPKVALFILIRGKFTDLSGIFVVVVIFVRGDDGNDVVSLGRRRRAPLIPFPFNAGTFGYELLLFPPSLPATRPRLSAATTIVLISFHCDDILFWRRQGGVIMLSVVVLSPPREGFHAGKRVLLLHHPLCRTEKTAFPIQ